jgi:DNA-binding beta-propeller fold protein YncE
VHNSSSTEAEKLLIRPTNQTVSKISFGKPMKTKTLTVCHSFGGVICAGAVLLAGSLPVRGQQIYVGRQNGLVGEYNADGTPVNTSLVTGVSDPDGLAISGNNLFVANQDSVANEFIGEYTMSGATVNASLITGLSRPTGIAVAPVPEPSALALLAVGASALLVGHRRWRSEKVSPKISSLLVSR